MYRRDLDSFLLDVNIIWNHGLIMSHYIHIVVEDKLNMGV